jgi:antitoxin MazE
MHTTIQKWGNSLALRIPKSFALETQINNGTEVEIKIKDKQLVISPVNKEKYNLDTLLSEITNSNVHKEIDFGELEGKELL